MTDSIRDWLLANDEGEVIRAWWRARDEDTIDWLRKNAVTMQHERLTVQEAYWRCEAAVSYTSLAAFKRAKRIVFPDGWRRGRPVLSADETDVEGQVKMGFVE